MDVPVYNTSGEQVSTFHIDEHSLGSEINPDLIKQAFVMYHANLRQGSARTKNRKLIEGSTRKLYKQKGTGRARHGDGNAPQFRGGGRAFAKQRTREDFRLAMPKKMRRKANRNALLAKLVDNEVKVIDHLAFDAPRTREFVKLLEALKVDRTALVALPGGSSEMKNAALSARNIDDVTICNSAQLTAFEMLNHRYLVISKDALQAWLAGPSSQTGKSARLEPMGAGAGAKPERPARPKRGPAARQGGAS